MNDFEDLIPVDGKEGWYRDPSTNAIVNGNKSEYDKYMASYNGRQKAKTEKETLQKEVSQLKSEMSDIKALLLTLVQNQKQFIMSIEQVSQTEMLRQFKERFKALIDENQQLATKIKENENVALKLQGAIEALEYYNPQAEETASHPPDEDEVDEVTAE